MRNIAPVLGLLCMVVTLTGCAARTNVDVTGVSRLPEFSAVPAPSPLTRLRALLPEIRQRILALHPERVTQQDITELLSQAPAPRIINIHGGLLPIKSGMNSFAEFLIGMGYPDGSIRNLENGSYTYGYYENGEKIAGVLAWYYEKEGLRPMLIGHSQGGIQAIRVLHILASDTVTSVAVWNPLTGKQEDRSEIRDPFTGQSRPVVGLRLSYATAAESGGLARALPNAWDMNAKLRSIPDSVDEFTGFQKGMDPFGGDYLGFGPSNDYQALGATQVRNVRLPAAGWHWTLPYIEKLLQDEAAKKWIQEYHPTEIGELELPGKGGKRAQILWAAEVWYAVKKRWVLELQRALRDEGGENGHA